MMFEIHAVSIQSYFWNQVHENARTRNDSKLFLMDLHKTFRNFQNFFIQAKCITVTALFIVLRLQEYVGES